MPLPTNRQPPGLLSFFGVKNGGTLPQYEGAAYVPTIELLDWLTADPLAGEFVVGSFAAATIGNFGTPTGSAFVVPAGQVWLVTDLTFLTTALGAGVSLQGSPCVAYPAGAVTFLSQVGFTTALFPATTSFSATILPGNHLIVPSGSQLGLLTNNLVGAAPTVTGGARIVRLTL